MTITTLRWGILGTGRIARQFAAALAHARHGSLHAVASRNAGTAEAEFAGARFHHGYEALLADPEVDAVYVATPHPSHATWSIRAAQAGKHILCEKPIGMNAAEAEAIIAAARAHDVFLMEAFMNRVHPMTAALVGLLRAGAIGKPRLIRSAFGYAKAYDPASRTYDRALGGGGILDVGCYPVSIARLVAGARVNRPFQDPIGLAAAGRIGPSGVDEWAVATLEFPDNLYAQLATGVAQAMDNTLRIDGERGHIHVPSPWWCSGREGGRGIITVQSRGETTEHAVETQDWLYAIEADAVARHIPAREVPSISWADTLGNMRTLDRWRAAIGLTYPGEGPAS